MADVRDAHGARWAVERKWWWLPDRLIVVDVLGWPFWFAAKFLGVPWKIVVEREGQQVGVEYVTGWAASKRRVWEISQSINPPTWVHHR